LTAMGFLRLSGSPLGKGLVKLLAQENFAA
jgi:hypothetical protein